MTKEYSREKNPVITTGAGIEGPRKHLSMTQRYLINALVVALFFFRRKCFGGRRSYFSLPNGHP